jgi:Glycosyltransferase family 87
MVEQLLDRSSVRAKGEPARSGAASDPTIRGETSDASRSRVLSVLFLLLGAVAWWQLGPAYVRVLRPAAQASPDFYQDWASARNHRLGLPVYSCHAMTMPLHLNRPQEEWEKDIQYNAHPPTSVLLALPLSGLDLPDAVLAWNLIAMAALLSSLAIVAANLPELKPLFLPVGLFLPFCLPIYGNFQQGQLTFILVLLITSAWALERSDRPVMAGMLLGTAAAVKLFPAYLVVYFVARRSWRGGLAAVATFGVLTLATAAVLGWPAYRDYIEIVLPSLEKFRSYGFNLSFCGFWHKLLDPVSERGCVTPLWYNPTLARQGILLSDLIATGLVAIAAYRARTRDQADLAFAMAVTAMLLVSPISWDYSLPLLLVPLALALRAAMASRWLPLLLVPVLTIFGVPQSKMMQYVLAGQPLRVASPAFILGVPTLNFYALLTLFVMLAVLAHAAIRNALLSPRSQISGTGLQ